MLKYAVQYIFYLLNVINVSFINVMNVKAINEHLLNGRIAIYGVFQHFDSLQLNPHVFDVEFGMQEFTTKTGIVMIRGAHQHSTPTMHKDILTPWP